jgi:co-chaperonin GroES (HSP10)
MSDGRPESTRISLVEAASTCASHIARERQTRNTENKFAGTELKLDGQQHLILREDDILAVVGK